MSMRSSFRKIALLAAAASIGLAAPGFAAAQPGPNYDSGQYDDQGRYDNQGGTYYDPCARDQANRSVIGGVLGAAAGATLGNSVTHGGAKLGGAIIGGTVGAIAGASVGHATAACQPGQPYGDPRDDAGYDGPPPPPPPPGAYGQNGYGQPPYGQSPYGQGGSGQDGYGGPDNRYAEEHNAYAPPPPSAREDCRMVEDRVFYPDGTTESSSVQACRDDRGHWHVVN